MGLTNWHALYVGRPNPGVTIQEGSRVFQPGSITSRDTIFDVVPDANYTDNDIGKVVDGVVNSRLTWGYSK